MADIKDLYIETWLQLSSLRIQQWQRGTCSYSVKQFEWKFNHIIDYLLKLLNYYIHSEAQKSESSSTNDSILLINII